MRRRYRQLMREQRGAAMVVVLCILAVFLALALSLLMVSSTLVGNAGAEMNNTRNKIAAVSFSDGFEADMADESSELNQYIRTQISSGAWQPGAEAEKAFEGTDEADGDASVSVAMYWERPEGLPSLELDGAILYVEITRTRGKASYRLKSEFELKCSKSGAEGETWEWHQTRRS